MTLSPPNNGYLSVRTVSVRDLLALTVDRPRMVFCAVRESTVNLFADTDLVGRYAKLDSET